MIKIGNDTIIVFDQDHYKAILKNAISNAQSYVWFSTADVKNFRISKKKNKTISVIERFEELLNRRVKIRILHSGNPSLDFERNQSKILEKNGFSMKQCNRNHQKIIIVDGNFAYLGSANFTGAGIGMKSENNRNFEVGIIINNKKIITDLKKRFLDIWDRAFCEKCQKPRKYCEYGISLGKKSK